jgi:hypothetical protein
VRAWEYSESGRAQGDAMLNELSCHGSATGRVGHFSRIYLYFSVFFSLPVALCTLGNRIGKVPGAGFGLGAP